MIEAVVCACARVFGKAERGTIGVKSVSLLLSGRGGVLIKSVIASTTHTRRSSFHTSQCSFDDMKNDFMFL